MAKYIGIGKIKQNKYNLKYIILKLFNFNIKIDNSYTPTLITIF